MKRDAGRIVQVFSSIQGEGLFLGQRQVFVRFAGCNLHCRYCDEAAARNPKAGETWTSRRLQAAITGCLKERPHSAVSWTGGEPLLQDGFLKTMMAWTRAQGVKNHLETNGTLADAFRGAVPFLDAAAVDIKLPSAVGKECWSEHLEFLRAAPEKTFVKVVLTARTTRAEWRQVIRLMQEVSPDIPLVLQPATARSGEESVAPETAVFFLRQAAALLKDVRLIPQWHPVWGLP